MHLDLESLLIVLNNRFSCSERLYLIQKLSESVNKELESSNVKDNNASKIVKEKNSGSKIEKLKPEDQQASNSSQDNPRDLNSEEILEKVFIFESLTGVQKSYISIKKAVLNVKPKVLGRLRNCIKNEFVHYGGIDDNEVNVIINQMMNDDIFDLLDEDKILWK